VTTFSNFYIIYDGERSGTFSLNSRVKLDWKYRIELGTPVRLLAGDEWIQSMRGFKTLSLIDFTPVMERISVSNEGYLPRYQAAWIEGLAATLPDPARIVEIGTGYGSSLVRILYGLALHEDAHVYTIDIEDCELAKGHVQDAKVPFWRYTFIISDSVKAAALDWEPLDMIYVDGSHSYEGVKADILAWQPRLKFGGIMVFDDYDNDLHEVTPAVNELMLANGDDWNFAGQVGTMIAFEKIDAAADSKD
jgi:predicted O-methyltransferase YrrM